MFAKCSSNQIRPIARNENVGLRHSLDLHWLVRQLRQQHIVALLNCNAVSGKLVVRRETCYSILLSLVLGQG